MSCTLYHVGLWTPLALAFPCVAVPLVCCPDWSGDDEYEYTGRWAHTLYNLLAIALAMSALISVGATEDCPMASVEVAIPLCLLGLVANLYGATKFACELPTRIDYLYGKDVYGKGPCRNPVQTNWEGIVELLHDVLNPYREDRRLARPTSRKPELTSTL